MISTNNMAHGQVVPSADEIAQRLRERNGSGFTKPATVHSDTPKTREIAAPTRMTRVQKKWEIERLLEEHKLHPIEEMIKLFKDGNRIGGVIVALDTDQKIKLLGMLADYTVPKVKSIEVSGSIEHQLTVNIVKFGGQLTATGGPLLQGATETRQQEIVDAVEVEDSQSFVKEGG